MFKYTLMLTCTLFACTLFAVQPAMAANTPALQQDEPASLVRKSSHPNYELQVTPYAWAAGIRGKVSPFVRTPTITLKKDFADIISDVNLAGFLNVWGRYDNYVFMGDVAYISIADSETIGPVPATPLPIPAGTVVNARLNNQLLMATLQGGYRVWENERIALDAMAGINYWYVATRIRLSALNRTFKHDEHFDWLDPVIGGRMTLNLSDKMSVQAHANIGGFGVGSKLTWMVQGTLNYAVTDSLTATAGVKALDVDYNKGGHVYNVKLTGPIVGLTWRF